MNTRGTDEHSVTVELPARFELVDKSGRLMGLYATPKEVAEDMRPGWTVRGINTETVWQRADRGPVKVA